MPITKTEVSTSIRPEIPSWVDSETKEQILEEVGRYVTTEIALHLGDGNSPVEGHGAFKKLSADYADEEKGGDTKPNLELGGDMLAALEWRVEMDEVKIGFFDKEEAIKAYGHNTGMKGHPWLEGKAPVRRIIPEVKENFKQDIQRGINLIVNEMVSSIEEEQEDDVSEGSSTRERTGGRRRNNETPDWLNGEDDDDDDWWL